MWWIVLVVVVAGLGAWTVARRSVKGGHADSESVRRTRGKDEGRGTGPTSI
ncbi:MAG TPA: hypothetical protein VFV89_05945 [Nocardioides sp.]|uniref:hypothetical protein n=1 Tax=Nocardioides sp. TaxID=35761 RepID=UPI002E36AD93|nr:hypothetical protein [Nocardioides sp.]HEX5087330.1 hypothetical protein [Nocardioides sp.]